MGDRYGMHLDLGTSVIGRPVGTQIPLVPVCFNLNILDIDDTRAILRYSQSTEVLYTVEDAYMIEIVFVSVEICTTLQVRNVSVGTQS